MANTRPTREIIVLPAEQSVEQSTSVQIPDTTTREALQAQQRYYQLRLTILGGVTIAFLVWAVVVTVLLAQATQKSCEYPTPTPPPPRVEVPPPMPTAQHPSLDAQERNRYLRKRIRSADPTADRDA